jgi:hypothetical protein
MSEIFAVQLTAAASVALTILALAAAVLAGLAFWRHPRKSGYSSSRTGVRGRAPGSLGRPRVSRRTARRRRPRHARNASDFPAYDAQIRYYDRAAGTWNEAVSQLPTT